MYEIGHPAEIKLSEEVEIAGITAVLDPFHAGCKAGKTLYEESRELLVSRLFRPIVAFVAGRRSSCCAVRRLFSVIRYRFILVNSHLVFLT